MLLDGVVQTPAKMGFDRCDTVLSLSSARARFSVVVSILGCIFLYYYLFSVDRLPNRWPFLSILGLLEDVWCVGGIGLLLCVVSCEDLPLESFAD